MMNVDAPTQKGLVLPGMKRENRFKSDQSTHSKRIPFLGFLPNAPRNHFIAMCGEFTGTFLFLLFALGGTQVVNANPTTASGSTLNADPAKLLYISLCFGMSLMVNAWVFFRISGGLFNPAVSSATPILAFFDSLQVTLGMCLVGAVPYFRGGLIVISQILGGIAAAAMVDALTPGRCDKRCSRIVHRDVPYSSARLYDLHVGRGETQINIHCTCRYWVESVHCRTSWYDTAIQHPHYHTNSTGVYYTGGSVNPARTFGPCVVIHSFYHYHWIYWIGPILGSLLASGFYMFMKVLEYETANPAQDADNENEHFDPESRNTEKPSVSFNPDSYANNRGSTMTGSTTNVK